ncbi:MAG: heparinase II/III family protein, partial [Clostridia bacterium]|nr:heparinase II/III family protein [Clostridia bacterium]
EAGKAFLERMEKEYKETYEGIPIPVLNYAYQKLYYQTGNRKLHETIHFDRRKRLKYLQILAIKSDAYLDELENIMAAICDEFSWVLPAHCYVEWEKPSFVYNRIDLFAAETAMYLAETVYVMGNKLSTDIQNRVKISLKQKIVDIFENNTCAVDYATNNWASVVGCGIGLSYIYLFPERFGFVKDRILKGMDAYLSGIDDEGYCSEGIAYWQYGFGFYAVFYDVYTQLFGDAEILKTEKVQNLLNAPVRSEMANDVYLPYADGGCRQFFIHEQIYYTVKNLFGSDFLFVPSELSTINSEKALGYRVLYALANATGGEQTSKESNFVYFKNAQVFLCKKDKYAFTTKGGNNDEMHNHNDLGAFQIVANGKRVIVDIGSGEYTKPYFNDMIARYGDGIFVCGSQSHAVPIIDGKYQICGKEIKAEVLNVSEEKIALDISQAYGKERGQVCVEYACEENGVRVKYTCKSLKDGATFRFVADEDCKPMEVNGKAVIENVTVENAQGVKPEISNRIYSNHQAQPTTAYIVDYSFKGENVQTEFFFSVN